MTQQVDKFNNPDDLEDYRLTYGEKEEENEVKRPNIELYEEGIRRLQRAGFRVEPSQGGNYAFHHIRKEMHPGDLKGLNIPKNFSMYRNIDDEGKAVLNELLEEINSWQSSDKQLYRLFEPMISPTANKTKPLHAIAMMMMARQTRQEVKRQTRYQDGISIGGGNGGRAFIPRHDWFDEKIRELTPGDLVTILPEAELSVFLLIIGRIVVGRDYSFTVEGTEIDHTFRALGILVDPIGGIGKSTLLRYINIALSWLGYEVQTLESPGSRFGWGKICRADVGYVDDLTKKSQKKFIEAENTKTIVSNEAISTEQKGVDSVSIQARTVLLANSNSFDQTDLFDVDPGIISRVNFLKCLNTSSINDESRVSPASADSPDYRTRPHWEWLCDQYDCDNKTLAMWLLRLAADEFLKVTGYQWDEKWNRYKKVNEDNLQEEFQWRRTRCKLGYTNHSTDNLFSLNRFLLLLTGEVELEKEEKEELFGEKSKLFILGLTRISIDYIKEVQELRGLDTVEGLNTDWGCIIEALQKDFEAKKRPPIHPIRAFMELDAFSSVKTALKEAETQNRLDAHPAEVLKGLLNNLQTTQGFRYVGASQKVSELWVSAMERDAELYSILEKLRELGGKRVYENCGKNNTLKISRITEFSYNFASLIRKPKK